MWVLFVTATLAGLCVGSFINVVAWRGPALWGLVDDPRPRGGFATPRSYCPACRTPIRAADLAPLVGFVRLKGRCRTCASAIPRRYPLVEALGGLVVVLALARFGWTAQALSGALFGFLLLALAVIDSETGYLPDALTLPLLATGVGAAILGAGVVDVRTALLGAAAGAGSFYAIAFGYRALKGRDGLGFGDAKLFGAIGAWTGPVLLPFVAGGAALATLAWLLLSRARVNADTETPLGPGLCAAGFAALLLAERLFSGL